MLNFGRVKFSLDFGGDSSKNIWGDTYSAFSVGGKEKVSDALWEVP